MIGKSGLGINEGMSMTIDARFAVDHATCPHHPKAHPEGLPPIRRIQRDVHRRIAMLIVAGGLVAPVATAETRGQMLYETHCVACHSVQIHWRAQRLAGDWNGLRGQVQLWQSNASLGWTDQDILEVARHLNQRYYQFPEPSSRLAKAAPIANRSGSGSQ